LASKNELPPSRISCAEIGIPWGPFIFQQAHNTDFLLRV
jgi:hypothetical protein